MHILYGCLSLESRPAAGWADDSSRVKEGTNSWLSTPLLEWNRTVVAAEIQAAVMAEALTIVGAVFGGINAAAKVIDSIEKLKKVTKAPEGASDLQKELRAVTAVLSKLQPYALSKQPMSLLSGAQDVELGRRRHDHDRHDHHDISI